MCFKSRKQPALALTILSVLIFCIGIAISALAIRFAVGDSFFTIKTLKGDIAEVDVDKFKNVSFGILLGAGIVAFATGFFGFFFTCCKSKSFAVIYGIFLSFTWIIILVLGCIVTAVSVGAPSELQAFCDGTLTTNEIAKQISQQLILIDKQMNSYIDTNMCSAICPCNVAYQSKWASLSEA